MLVIDDLCGDEDDVYLWCEYFKRHMHEVLYKELVNLWKVKPYTTEINNIVIDQPARYISFTAEVK